MKKTQCRQATKKEIKEYEEYKKICDKVIALADEKKGLQYIDFEGVRYTVFGGGNSTLSGQIEVVNSEIIENLK